MRETLPSSVSPDRGAGARRRSRPHIQQGGRTPTAAANRPAHGGRSIGARAAQHSASSGECGIELNPIAILPLRGKSRILFLLSRDHVRPAQALRKSAIKSERPLWNVRDNPCPPSKTHVTNATHSSSSKD